MTFWTSFYPAEFAILVAVSWLSSVGSAYLGRARTREMGVATTRPWTGLLDLPRGWSLWRTRDRGHLLLCESTGPEL